MYFFWFMMITFVVVVFISKQIPYIPYLRVPDVVIPCRILLSNFIEAYYLQDHCLLLITNCSLEFQLFDEMGFNT